MGREARLVRERRFHLRREEVGAADDEHVVAPALDALDAAHGPGGAGHEAGQVAGAVADDGHRFLGERGEDELAFGAVGEHFAGFRIDHFGQEMVFPERQAVLGLRAFLRDAGPQHFGEAVDV